MKSYGDAMRADGLDRVRQLDASPVEGGAARSFHGFGDVGGGHRTEQPAAITCPTRQPDIQGLQGRCDVLRLTEVADLTHFACAPDRRDLLLPAARPPD